MTKSLATWPENVENGSSRRIYRMATNLFAMAMAIQESSYILPTAERHAKADMLYTISNELLQTIGKQPESALDVKKARAKY